jgi:hypothetical protein
MNNVGSSFGLRTALNLDAFVDRVFDVSGRFVHSFLAPKRFRKLDESGQVDRQLVPVSLLVTQLTHPAYQSGSLPEV